MGLSRRFDAVTAVDDLSLEIHEGCVFGFLGPNGAGKTTTMRLLLGLLEPSAGQVSVLGHDVAAEGVEVRRSCGVLLEHTGLYERLTAEDNLDYFAKLWHLSSDVTRARVDELLGHFGLSNRRREIVGTWSRGMKQKLALARALLHRPRVVFLDEPTAGLDPIAAAGLRTDLLELARRESVTVFITTHNLDEAERMCDRVGVIRSGQLIAEGRPDDLRRRTGHSLTIDGSGFDRALEPLRQRSEVASVTATNGRLEILLRGEGSTASLIRLLVESGVNIEEVRKGAGSLEEAFLALVEDPTSSSASSREPTR